MSLEGLNALIQLESVRLEGAKQTTSNISQVQSEVRQTGLQTAQSRNNMNLEKIKAEYQKELAEAEVHFIERKLVRKEAAKTLAFTIAGVVGATSLISGLYDNIFRDLIFGDQNLDDIPENLQTQPIDPSNAQVMIHHHQGSSADTVYMAGSNSDGSETVQSFTQGGSGEVPPTGLRAATITGEDKARILGERYRNMSFAQIQSENPQLAERLMQDKSHGLARGEAEDFFRVIESTPELEPYVENVHQSLISSGKVDTDSVLGDTVNALFNTLVTTAETSIPFFQAALAMKNEVEELEDELLRAKQRLEAASKQLNRIEMQVDEFAGRGA